MTDENQPDRNTSPRRTLRIVTAGAVAAALLAAGAPKLVETYALFSGKPAPVEGLDDIDTGLAQVAGTAVTLTEEDGDIDLLYIGATECGHCQEFMASSFEDLVDVAKTKGLDMAFMPAAMTPVGLTGETLVHCARPKTEFTPVELVQAGYGIIDGLWETAEHVRAGMKEGMGQAEAERLYGQGLVEAHAALGTPEGFDQSCYEAAAFSVADDIEAAGEIFKVKGTPSFYFDTPEGVISITGNPGFDELLATIESAF